MYNPRVAIGTAVYKRWSKKWYFGRVDDFDRGTGWYRITYEDGDSEDHSDNEEVQEIITFATRKKQQDERYERDDPLEFDWLKECREVSSWQHKGSKIRWMPESNEESALAHRRLRERAIKFRYEYEGDAALFLDAMELCNRRYLQIRLEEKLYGNQNIPDKLGRVDQKLFLCKIVLAAPGQYCKECRVNLRMGEVYFYDEFLRRREPDGQSLCAGCMGRTLRAIVGTDRHVIHHELKRIRMVQPLENIDVWSGQEYYRARLNGVQLPMKFRYL
jgi:hypothetical protein